MNAGPSGGAWKRRKTPLQDGPSFCCVGTCNKHIISMASAANGCLCKTAYFVRHTLVKEYGANPLCRSTTAYAYALQLIQRDFTIRSFGRRRYTSHGFAAKARHECEQPKVTANYRDRSLPFHIFQNSLPLVACRTHVPIPRLFAISALTPRGNYAILCTTYSVRDTLHRV
jgi:hypothetical protein